MIKTAISTSSSKEFIDIFNPKSFSELIPDVTSQAVANGRLYVMASINFRIWWNCKKVSGCFYRRCLGQCLLGRQEEGIDTCFTDVLYVRGIVLFAVFKKVTSRAKLGNS